MAMKLKFSDIIKNVTPYGLVMGGIFVITSLLMYVVNIDIFSPVVSILNLLLIVIAVPIIIVVVGTNNLRRKIAPDRVITFGQAWLSCFTILFIGFAISGLYNYVFMHWIAPDYLKDNLDKMTDMLEKYNMSQEQIDQTIQKVQDRTEGVTQYLWSAGIMIVLSLILAVSVRKKDKVSETIL